jgi:DNA-binding FadR family transcriptional regulator
LAPGVGASEKFEVGRSPIREALTFYLERKAFPR